MELIRTAAADGLRLDGALYPATGPSQLDSDLAIFLHGVGGNFQGGSLFKPLVEKLNRAGVAAYRVNNRGHDSLFSAETSSGERKFGAAMEIVDECRLDIAAWIQHATDFGYERVTIVGHSLGAIKAIYSQAHEPNPHVVAIVAMSPPRLSYAHFYDSKQSESFLATMAEAQKLVNSGNRDQLLETDFPVRLTISALTFYDKYGPAERYNICRFLDRLAPPTLLMYGEKEIASDNAAFADLPRVIGELPNLPPTLDLSVVGEADHFYSGVREEAADAAFGWLNTRLT